METGQKYYEKAEGWLRRAVRMTPHPMPKGRFERIIRDAEAAGYERSTVLDVLDEWLNYGYVRLLDPLSHDIEILPAGETLLVAGPPREPEARA